MMLLKDHRPMMGSIHKGLGARRREAGFTMIEILISMAILAGMSTLIWGSFSMSSNAKRKIEQVEARYHQIRLAMNRMAREISMSFLSKNDMVGALHPRTLFTSARNNSVDDLMFTGLSHMMLRANGKECDQSLIRYYAETDPEDRSRSHLMRRESRRLGGEKPGEEGPAYIMLEDVEELHYEFFDETANEWREDWDTTSADGQADRLPTKVRIVVTLIMEGKKEITLTTGTRLHMRDPLWFSSK